MRLRSRSFTSVMASIAAVLISTFGAVALAAPEECVPGDGVTVVVDFAGFGGTVEVGCAPGSPPSGFEALGAAGFEVTKVQSNPGFVCRLNGLPDAASDGCQTIPPATAFWSYWTAVRGGNWRLSQTGASGAPQGDYEGWTFSSGNSAPPRFSIPAAATTTTTATTATTTSSSTTATSPTTTATTVGATATSTTTVTSPTTTATNPTTTVTTPTTAATTPTTTGTNPTTTATTPTTTGTNPTTTGTNPTTTGTNPTTTGTSPTTAGDGGTGFGGSVLAVAVIAAGGLGAGLVSRRRRREQNS